MLKLSKLNLPGWRNWFTRTTQNRMGAIPCGFESHPRHRNMPEVVKKFKEEVEETKEAFKEKIVTLILGGFGLVAALAWNEAIKSLFEFLLPKKSSELIGKFIYALIVTLIVVIFSRYLGKTSDKKE